MDCGGEETSGAGSHHMTFCSPSHASSLLKELQRLREADTTCDVTLQVNGGSNRRRSLRAHRMVLVAASPFFAAMFSSDMRESRSGLVELNNVDPTAVEKLLDFAYTSKISFSYSSALQLIAASDMLQFPEVQQACSDYLQHSLSPTNCLELLQFAGVHSCTELLRAAQLHCNLHFESVSRRPEFLELPVDQLEAYLSSDRLRVEGERCVLDAALCWLEHDVVSRSQHAYRVLCCVRLSLLPPDTLLDVVWVHHLVSGNLQCMELLRRALSVHILPANTTSLQEQV